MLKMRELIKATGEAKSTILFYVKEGLLPEPKKPKPNVHLYDESCVDIIKFIKYLQSTYSYSISEIKEIFKNFDFKKENSFYLMVKALELTNITKDNKFISKNEFLKEAQISKDELSEFLQKEYIYERKEGFGQKEVEIVKIIKELKKHNLEELVEAYVKSAKEIAKIEIEIWANLFKVKRTDTIKEHQLAFETTLTLKPYIYNMQTLNAYYKEKFGEVIMPKKDKK